MSLLQRVKKPITHKGKKVLLSREPKLIEDPKNVLLLKGRKTSERNSAAITDIYHLKKPQSRMLSKRNDVNAFENIVPVEELTRKNESTLFVLATNSKKRPHNLVVGRMFDNRILDMVELGIDNYTSLKDFKNEKIGTGVKPCLIFNGPAWEQSKELARLKNLFIDLFHREQVETIRLQGLEHVLSFTVTEGSTILLRSYQVQLKKSGQRTPRVELKEIGPSADFSLRRSKLATDELWKLACTRPKALKLVKKKNISRDGLGTTHGRIHLGKQNIHKIQTRKMKGLKKTPQERKAKRIMKESST